MQVSDFIENRTFDEIIIGESASLTRTLSKDDIALFAVMSGDVNPAHLDERYVPRQASFIALSLTGCGAVRWFPQFWGHGFPAPAPSILSRTCASASRSAWAILSR